MGSRFLRHAFVMCIMVAPIMKRYEWRVHHNETFGVCSCAVTNPVADAGTWGIKTVIDYSFALFIYTFLSGMS